jgi:hypothetical protein
METVYYVPLDGHGEETDEVVPVTLAADGSADISHLPEWLRRTYEQVGVYAQGKQFRVFPRDGEAFLRGLLAATNGYVRFRSKATAQNPFSL